MDNLANFLKVLKDKVVVEQKAPVMFVGHGSPMNAVESNEFSRTWKEVGGNLPKPENILVISAHWQTRGTWVTAMEKPRTIHDFYGFPRELFEQQYPAPGNADLANQIAATDNKYKIGLDHDWGFDHGTWSVLKTMFPEAEIPVLQLSLDATKAPRYHFELAKILGELRNKGVLIIGSGNIVHNLSRMQFTPKAYDWAIEFDEKVKALIDSGDYQSLVNYESLGKAAHLSIPTNEHYLPMLYILALTNNDEETVYFIETTTMGSVSMRSFISN